MEENIEEIKDKKKIFSDKKNIAIIILLILLIICLGVQLVSFGDDKALIKINSSLTSIVEEKEQTIEDNKIQIQNLQSSTTIQNTNSTIVYVTKTGEKYHKSSCSYLRQSKIQINLSDAKAQGYTPCSRCY